MLILEKIKSLIKSRINSNKYTNILDILDIPEVARKFSLHFVKNESDYFNTQKGIIETFVIENNKDVNIDLLYDFLTRNYTKYPANLTKMEVVLKSIPYYYVRDLIKFGYTKTKTYSSDLLISEHSIWKDVYPEEYRNECILMGKI